MRNRGYSNVQQSSLIKEIFHVKCSFYVNIHNFWSATHFGPIPLYLSFLHYILHLITIFVREGTDVFLHTNLDIFDAGQNCTLVGPGHGSMVFGLSTKSYILSGTCSVQTLLLSGDSGWQPMVFVSCLEMGAGLTSFTLTSAIVRFNKSLFAIA